MPQYFIDGAPSSSNSSEDLAGVTINFESRRSSQEESTNETSLLHTNNDTSPKEETVAEKSLPWQDNSEDPSPTHLADNFPNNDPVIAHVPSWVNNLSYSHITETGSPYVSPQTTIIPRASDNHKSLQSIFPQLLELQEKETNGNSVNSSDNHFPTPWGKNSDLGDECPQLSPMVTESGERTCDLLHSSHMSQAPDHHHVIIPTTFHLQLDSDSSTKNVTHLSEVASAPDIQHWKPIKSKLNSGHVNRLQSDSMLMEMAFQEGVKNRVQEWLIQAEEDSANDADSEDNDDECQDTLESADALERELDLEMNAKP